MLRGLEGRRIALFAAPEKGPTQQNGARVKDALERAGARVDVLQKGRGTDEDWQGTRYAAVVVIGDEGSLDGDPRLVQLVREFMVSDKPVAAFGGGVATILEAAGAAGRTIAASGPLTAALAQAGATVADEPIQVDEALLTASAAADVDTFATKVVAELSQRMEERDIDEMSELSFPASDPPASSPATAGPAPDTSEGRS